MRFIPGNSPKSHKPVGRGDLRPLMIQDRRGIPRSPTRRRKAADGPHPPPTAIEEIRQIASQNVIAVLGAQIIGDALSGMGGPVKALRDDSPQAVHHYTVSDQVNALVTASEADPDLGFMARMMALCSLPRTNPGDRCELFEHPCLQFIGGHVGEFDFKVRHGVLAFVFGEVGDREGFAGGFCFDQPCTRSFFAERASLTETVLSLALNPRRTVSRSSSSSESSSHPGFSRSRSLP